MRNAFMSPPLGQQHSSLRSRIDASLQKAKSAKIAPGNQLRTTDGTRASINAELISARTAVQTTTATEYELRVPGRQRAFWPLPAVAAPFAHRAHTLGWRRQPGTGPPAGRA